MRTFKEATDVLGIPAPELAGILKVSAQSIRQSRLDTESAGFRDPPPGWKRAIAKLARKRAAELVRLANDLEREA